jgi:hypothetical protein
MVTQMSNFGSLRRLDGDLCASLRSAQMRFDEANRQIHAANVQVLRASAVIRRVRMHLEQRQLRPAETVDEMMSRRWFNR